MGGSCLAPSKPLTLQPPHLLHHCTARPFPWLVALKLLVSHCKLWFDHVPLLKPRVMQSMSPALVRKARCRCDPTLKPVPNLLLGAPFISAC